jgi:hypothetical protein
MMWCDVMELTPQLGVQLSMRYVHRACPLVYEYEHETNNNNNNRMGYVTYFKVRKCVLYLSDDTKSTAATGTTKTWRAAIC